MSSLTMAALLSSFFILLFPIIIKSDCGMWTVDGKTLDLHCLSGEVSKSNTGSGSPLVYVWSLCDNAIFNSLCGNHSVMVTETYGNPDTCNVLGKWDPYIQPTYEINTHGEQWTFEYANGEPCSKSHVNTWKPTFVCAPGVVMDVGYTSFTNDHSVVQT